MTLKSGRTRSELSGVFSAIPDSVQTHMEHWWPMDEGAGTTLNDGLGSENLTLNNGGSWATASKFEGGTAPDFDQTDDWAVSNNQLAIAGSDWSVCGWVEMDGWDGFSRIVSAPSKSNTSDSASGSGEWDLIDNGSDKWKLRFEGSDDGASDESLSTNQDYFLALAGSGNNGDWYIWDDSSQIRSQSINTSLSTATRYLRFMVAADNYVGGTLDAWSANQSTKLSESNFQDIWNDTKAGRG